MIANGFTFKETYEDGALAEGLNKSGRTAELAKPEASKRC